MRADVHRAAVIALQCMLWCGCTVEGQGQETRIAVVGLFQVKESANGFCDDEKTYIPSVMAIEAIKWSFRNLFDHGDAPEIHLIPYKTCGLSGKTTEQMIQILSNRSTDQENNIVGIIGPEFSEESRIVSEMITSLPESKHIAQLSYSATAQLLSDKKKFRNFFRVIPSDEIQVETMVGLMVKLQWNRIAIVHDDDLYGSEVAKSLQTMANKRGICIPTVQEITSKGTNTDEYQRVLDEILVNAKPPIKGLVFVGRRNVAHLFMKFMSKDSDFTNTPALILSESVQLQRDVFSDTDGDIFDTSKGSYALSPDYRDVTEFSDYWRGLFLNITELTKEQITNPWLLDVYKESFGCEPGGTTSCPPLSATRIKRDFEEQPLYVRYAIIAAFTLAGAIRNSVEETCGNTQVCNEFMDRSRSMDVLRAMESLSISTGKDFAFRPTGLGDTSISFDVSSGENLGNTPYKVYNLRVGVDDTMNEFSFVEVGINNGTSIDINTDEIIDYYYSSGTIQPYTWPDIRKAQCPVQHFCSECVSSRSGDNFIFIEGDLYIVGLVPNHDSDSKFGCGSLAQKNLNGFGNSIAMEKAVEDANKNDVFRGQRVGLVIFDSCSNPILSDWIIKDLLKSGLTLKNGSTIFIYDKILGVSADYFSSISIAISQTLTTQKILQIAYGASSPLLSDRGMFPYFIRVATPDQKQTNAAVRIITQIGANYVQLLYSDDAYGVGFRDAFLLAAEKEDICVVSKISIHAESSSKLNQVYEQLRNKPFAKLVVVALSTFVNELLESVTEFMEPGEFVFLGSETWGLDVTRLTERNSFKLLGSITIHLEYPDIYGIGERMKDVDKDKDAERPWVEEYLQSTMRCHYDTSFDKRFAKRCNETFREFWDTNNLQVISWGPFSYLSIQSLLNASSLFLAERCLTVENVCDSYREEILELIALMKENSKFDLQGKGELTRVFDENGDGNVGYVIYNIQKSQENPTQLQYVEVGRYSADGQFFLTQDLVVGTPNKPFVSVCPNEKACSECLSPPDNLPPPETSSRQSATPIVMGTIIGVLALALIILFVVVFYMRRTIQKQRSAGDGYITPTDVTKNFDNIAYGGHLPDE